MLKLILLLASFFLGAVPFGYIAAKRVKNIDIRKFGSGNIGATNVFRVVGKKWGIFVFILDFLKGFVFPFFAFILLNRKVEPYFFIFLGIFAVLGHNWTPFLKFKGGKGVATSLGALFALSFPFSCLRLILLFTLLAWLAVFFLFRMVSLASLFAGFIFLILALFLASSVEIIVLAVILFLLILVRHIKNIKRVIKREENRI